MRAVTVGGWHPRPHASSQGHGLLREGVACRRRPRLPTADLPPGRGPALSPVKEEEKQKLLQRGSELQSGRQQLEERDRRLASAVKVRGARGGGVGLP